MSNVELMTLVKAARTSTISVSSYSDLLRQNTGLAHNHSLVVPSPYLSPFHPNVSHITTGQSLRSWSVIIAPPPVWQRSRHRTLELGYVIICFAQIFSSGNEEI